MLLRGTISSQSFCKRSWQKWRTWLSRRLRSRGPTRSGRCPTICHGGSLRGGGVGQCARGPGMFSRFGRILPGCLGRLNVRILAAGIRDRSGVHGCRGVCSRGSSVASIAESAKSSPNRQAFETIMNCSAQSYSTRFTVNGERSIGKKAEGAARIRRHRC